MNTVKMTEEELEEARNIGNALAHWVMTTE